MAADETLTVAVEANTSGFERTLDDLSAKANAFGTAFTGAFKAAAGGGRSLDSVMRQLGQRISSLALSAALKPLESAVGGLFGQVLGGLGGIGSGGAGAATATVTPFAKGGVVASPSFFPNGRQIGLMGEAGAEAILPLKRGADGTLGVAAGGGGGAKSGQTIVFNVTTSDAGSFRRSEAQVQAMLARAAGRGQRGL